MPRKRLSSAAFIALIVVAGCSDHGRAARPGREPSSVVRPSVGGLAKEGYFTDVHSDATRFRIDVTASSASATVRCCATA